MPEILCPKCHKQIGAADAAFCPFCGEKLQSEGPDLAAAIAEADPVKKHEMLLSLKERYPGNADIAEEILHLGRLYDRGKKGMDFSVIKCYMLNIYLDPAVIKKKRREELRQEIFHHPDLEDYLACSENKEAALRRYLIRLSEEFIRLFLKGSSQHMHAIFGYVNESKAPKHLALPAANMLRGMQQDGALEETQRQSLMQAFYEAFRRQMDGQTQYLDVYVDKFQLTIAQKTGE